LKEKGSYTYVFVNEYKRDDFHFTCACSTLDYLVVSRLPFSEPELRMEMEKNQAYDRFMKDSLEKDGRFEAMLLKLKQTEEALRNTSVLLIEAQKNQLLIAKQQEDRRKEEEKRKEEEARRKREIEEKAYRERIRAEEDRRRRDPIDFFVWDFENRKYEHVIEYHKDADVVYFVGKEKLFIVKFGGTHQFEMLLTPEKLRQFIGYPLRLDNGKKLSPLF